MKSAGKDKGRIRMGKTTISESELQRAWGFVNQEFPFEGYIRPARKTGYFEMVRKIAKWTKRDARVLDFGAGPCDKTALFSQTGMNVTAFDNLEDAWHKLGNNRSMILEFAKRMGIRYLLPRPEEPLPFKGEQFDVVMTHDVLEHWHSSPRVILNILLGCLKPGGVLAITVPNAANLRKRIHILLGKTNYNRFEYFYWYPGLWNGHVREYVQNDLKLLNKYLGLECLDLSSYSLQLDVLPRYLRKSFSVISGLFPGVRDSWMLISRKPENWSPNFKPNSDQFERAFGGQYFDYSHADFDWEE